MSELNHLTVQDMHAAMKALGRLHGHADAEAFPKLVVEAISPLVSNEALHYNEFERKRMVRAVAREGDPVTPELLTVFASHAHQHPGFAYVERTRDGSAHTISDFLSRANWRRLPLYNEFYRRLGHDDQMYFTVEVSPDAGRIVSVAMNRTRPSFSERERGLLNLMRPYIVQAYANAKAVGDLRQESAAARGALEATDRGVVALTREGRVRWVTPRAAALLAGSRSGRRRRADQLPPVVREWVLRHVMRGRSLPLPREPFEVPAPAGRLRVRLLENPAGEGMLLLIEEPATAAHLPAIAPRLRKVLSAMLSGRSEKQIAAELSLSRHTVHQYVKEIYRKVGVNSRPELMAQHLPDQSRSE